MSAQPTVFYFSPPSRIFIGKSKDFQKFFSSSRVKFAKLILKVQGIMSSITVDIKVFKIIDIRKNSRPTNPISFSAWKSKHNNFFSGLMCFVCGFFVCFGFVFIGVNCRILETFMLSLKLSIHTTSLLFGVKTI
jgi:hypothetical protein